MFREAQSGDFDEVLRLYLQLNLDDPVPDGRSAKETFEQIMASPGLHLFVLELDGAVVATTYLNVIPNLSRSVAPYAVIENVVVEKRLRGIGRSASGSWPTRSRQPGRQAATRRCS
jgi:hypothetical protein